MAASARRPRPCRASSESWNGHLTWPARDRAGRPSLGLSVLLSRGQGETGVPARCAAAAWWLNRAHVVTATCEQPGDQRIGIPHVAAAEFVATPGERRDSDHEVEQCVDLTRVGADPVRAL